MAGSGRRAGLCDVCGIREVRITLTGEDRYCLDCHNERMARKHGLNRLAHFEREIVAHDASNRPHRLSISNLLMPGFSEWTAEEEGGGYRSVVIAKPEDNQETALQELHRNIHAALQQRTLIRQSDKHVLSNALQNADGQYTLQQTGCGRIESDAEGDGVHLVIDGMSVSAADFLNMLTMYENHNLLYQVRELSDGILEKDSVLMPVSIAAEKVIQRFEETLGWFLDRSFLSCKLEAACCAALSERLDEYELLCRYGERDTARRVGKYLIDRLLSIAHDTVDFPDLLVESIENSMPEELPGGASNG